MCNGLARVMDTRDAEAANSVERSTGGLCIVYLWIPLAEASANRRRVHSFDSDQVSGILLIGASISNQSASQDLESAFCVRVLAFCEYHCLLQERFYSSPSKRSCRQRIGIDFHLWIAKKVVIASLGGVVAY